MSKHLMRCPKHNRELVHQKTQYGGRWKCPEKGCDILCWSGSTSTPADKETREARTKCHGEFDELWKVGPGRKFKRRGDAYKWLAKELGIGHDKMHFGMMSVAQCKKALAVIERMLKEKK